ncbi:MAG: DUF4097 domain-containing protein [Actinomycetota bacterium]|nr:DUF4097 domain-containing protein [Actinomycetota bacterium]MDQ2957429.1 DUF4097 domain-containing protein [Actinomycetota bacterium]
MTSYTFALTEPIDLSCRFRQGSLVVRAEDGRTEAEVSVTPRAAGSDVLDHSTIELDGHTLVVHVPTDRNSVFESFFQRQHSRDAVDVLIQLPSGSPLNVAVYSADITVHGRTGSVQLAGGSSQIVLDQVDGELQVRGGSGDIRVETVSGSANFKGGSGTVRIGEAGSDVTVSVGTGALDLGIARGPVRMRSGSGDVVIGTAERDVDVTSGSGALVIGLPAGQAARLDVLTGSGRLNTEMPMEGSAPVGGQPITVRARTGSGDVTIRRCTAPVS